MSACSGALRADDPQGRSGGLVQPGLVTLLEAVHTAPSKGGITGHEQTFDVVTLAVRERGVKGGVS